MLTQLNTVLSLCTNYRSKQILTSKVSKLQLEKDRKAKKQTKKKKMSEKIYKTPIFADFCVVFLAELMYECKERPEGDCFNLLPAVVLDHMRQLDDELALLVLLRRLERLLIEPADVVIAGDAEYIAYGMEASRQYSVLARTLRNVDHSAKEIGSAMPALEGLGNEFIVKCQVRLACRAAIDLSAR